MDYTVHFIRMKLKVKAEDFVVREISSVVINDKPDVYRVYRLKKTQWDSFDLTDVLSRKLGILKSDISMSGRKDRYGTAVQLLAVRENPGLPPTVEEHGFSLVHAGYTDRKLTAESIAGNSFRITLRDIEPEYITTLKKNCIEVRQAGFPNYFDEQRFGSARAGRGFLGKALFLGRMEEALKIYLAPDGHETAAERTFKKEAVGLWRQWHKITAPVPRKLAPVMHILKSPGGYMAFKKAVNAINRDIIIMALQAYQSYLFNRLAVHYLDGLTKAGRLSELRTYPFKFGELLFYGAVDEKVLNGLTETVLPVPGHDTATVDPLVKQSLAAVLDEEHIALTDLKVKKLPGKAVRGVERRLVVVPQEFAFDEPKDDELYPGRKKLTLHFSLPRGSYATMLVKRIQTER